MTTFAVMYRPASHADAGCLSRKIEAVDIDEATRLAIDDCDADDYVAAVWQADTPSELLSWHAATHDDAL